MKVFQPYVMGGKIRFANRIMMAPIAVCLVAADEFTLRKMAERYLLYAQGGSGFVLVGGVAIKRKRDSHFMCLADDSVIKDLSTLTDRVHDETESKIGIQLTYFRRTSASANILPAEQLSVREIWQMPRLFADAALRARRSGFDAIELHFRLVSTYSLVSSCLFGKNRQFGGSMDKRIQMIERVVKAIRKKVGNDYVIGTVMNGSEFCVYGNTVRQAHLVALRLSELGVDYLRVSSGTKAEFVIPRRVKALHGETGLKQGYGGSANWMPERVNADLCADLKRSITNSGDKMSIITSGRILTADVAEEVLKGGEADMVAMRRPLICDPFWPRKYKEGRKKEIKTCSYCNWCGRELASVGEIGCCIELKKEGQNIHSGAC
jgi:2,4-dienoyl-CoA reductase-like NADH-dependent reductase (Old Yellow Enzyme family)